ncbi:unnamed protein product, partial [Heterosigma akashiwo]
PRARGLRGRHNGPRLPRGPARGRGRHGRGQGPPERPVGRPPVPGAGLRGRVPVRGLGGGRRAGRGGRAAPGVGRGVRQQDRRLRVGLPLRRKERRRGQRAHGLWGWRR